MDKKKAINYKMLYEKVKQESIKRKTKIRELEHQIKSLFIELEYHRHKHVETMLNELNQL